MTTLPLIITDAWRETQSALISIPMRRLIFIIVLIITISEQAHAQSLGDRLGDTLRQLGRTAEEVIKKGRDRLEEGIESLQAEQSPPEQTGTCLVLSPQGNQIDREPCRKQNICSKNEPCQYHYLWPSGSETVVQYKPSGSAVINGKPATPVTIDGSHCLTNSGSGNSFCFLADDLEAEEEEDFQTAENQASDEPAENSNNPIGLNVLPTLSAEEVESFFAEHSLNTLSPVEGKKACEKHFLNPDDKLIVLTIKQVTSRARRLCANGADAYGQRLAIELVQEAADAVLALPATYEGMREGNWFRLDETKLQQFSTAHRKFAIEEYALRITQHAKAAMADAGNTIEAAFEKATPLTESADAAMAYCAERNRMPRELAQICANAIEKFRERTHLARCDLVVDQSGASKAERNRAIAVAGRGYKTWSVRKVICTGAENRPGYVISFHSGVPLIGTPRIVIKDKSDRIVLDAELELTSPRDNRGLMQIMWDVATGENEKPVTETYWVTGIREASASARNYPADRAIACVLALMDCS